MLIGGYKEPVKRAGANRFRQADRPTYLTGNEDISGAK